MKKDARLTLSLAIGLAATAGVQSPTVRARPLTGPMLVNASFSAAQGRNVINGRIFGPNRQPVGDMYVELLDEVGSAITRAKADSSGRFTFRGLSDGRYKVKVLPYGTDYLEQIQEVVLYSVSAVAGGGADQQQIDIYLRANERANANPFAAAPTVIFAQEVPPEAKKLYEQGLNFLRDKKEKEALDSLRKSIEVFPNYYLALDRLGAEYAMRGASNRSYYEAAVVLLTKAAEVNPRGFSSVFGLGVSQYQLGMINEAAQNLQRAIEIYGKAPDPHLWLGKAQKRAAKLELAEASFKQANTLTGGKSAEVHWQLAGLYSDQKRYAEAADELELFLKLQPKATDGEKIKGLIAQLRAKAGAK